MDGREMQDGGKALLGREGVDEDRNRCEWTFKRHPMRRRTRCALRDWDAGKNSHRTSHADPSEGTRAPVFHDIHPTRVIIRLARANPGYIYTAISALTANNVSIRY